MVRHGRDQDDVAQSEHALAKLAELLRAIGVAMHQHDGACRLGIVRQQLEAADGVHGGRFAGAPGFDALQRLGVALGRARAR